MKQVQFTYDPAMRLDVEDGVIKVFLRTESSATGWIMDTREKLIRDGLIKLGWTPPSSCPPIPASSPPA